MKRKLFRYRSFDNEIVNDYSYIHQRMVNVEKWKFEAFEGLVYPSSPLYFNDPYDCEFCFQADTIDELLDRKEYIQLLENRFPLKKEEKNRILYSDDIEKAMEIILRSHGGKLSDSLKNILQNGLNNCMNEIKDSIRVVCLSEVYNSMLMWSHYAQNHKGFCIEYEFDESNTFYKHLHPIIYTKERYTTSKRDMSNTNGKWIYKTICRKSDVWSYEKEWRIVTVNFNKVMPDKLKYPNGKYDLDLKENIKAFYLGAKIEKKYKEEIIWFAKQNNVEVYQMNLSPDSYDLITKRMI